MKPIEAIEKRQSIREFRKLKLTEKQINEIRDYYTSIKALVPDIETELVISTGDDAKIRLEGSAGYRGHAFGAPAYITILSEKKENYVLNAGFIAENLILKLVEMSIENCWLTTNGSDNIKRALCLEESDKEAVVVIACGEGKKERTLTRLDIKTPSNVKVSKRKGHIAPKIAQDEMVFYGKWGEPVDWTIIDPQLDRALYAASLAPSFLNRQPYRYILDDHHVILLSRLSEEGTSEEDIILDSGATMANFDAVYSGYYSNCKGWICGEPSGAEAVSTPEGFRIVAYYDLV